jgi:hypothetical protein
MSTERQGRSAPALQVILSYRPLGLVRAQPRNLHFDGILVDTGPVGLDHGAEVEVTLCYQRGSDSQSQTLGAQVTADTHEGTYLRFAEYGVEQFLLLDSLINAGSEGDSAPVHCPSPWAASAQI